MAEKFSKYPNIYISNIQTSISNTTTNDNENDEFKKSKVLFSRVFPNDVINSTDSYQFFYIGQNESTLNPLIFYFNRNKFFKFNFSKSNDDNRSASSFQLDEITFSRTNRELMKRYYLIEKARDCKIFGILIGTMSVSKYKEAINHVESVLKKAGRRYYSFLIGKLNCPKLNNFMEVDMYVLISCNENSLINSKELNKPIITVYELEIAFNSARLWGGEFVCDFKTLLPGNEHYLETKLSDQESDVSLITGETRFLNRALDGGESNSENGKMLVNRNDTLSVMHYAAAGLFVF